MLSNTRSGATSVVTYAELNVTSTDGTMPPQLEAEERFEKSVDVDGYLLPDAVSVKVDKVSEYVEYEDISDEPRKHEVESERRMDTSTADIEGLNHVYFEGDHKESASENKMYQNAWVAAPRGRNKRYNKYDTNPY